MGFSLPTHLSASRGVVSILAECKWAGADLECKCSVKDPLKHRPQRALAARVTHSKWMKAPVALVLPLLKVVWITKMSEINCRPRLLPDGCCVVVFFHSATSSSCPSFVYSFFLFFPCCHAALRDHRIELVRASWQELTIRISDVSLSDEGQYTCSLFTMPVKTTKAFLTVLGECDPTHMALHDSCSRVQRLDNIPLKLEMVTIRPETSAHLRVGLAFEAVVSWKALTFCF